MEKKDGQKQRNGFQLGGIFLVADNVSVNDWYFNILGPWKLISGF